MRLRGSVYVVAKSPRPGACKTRLCPPLTHAQAAGLAAAFLRDTVLMVKRAGQKAAVICRDDSEQMDLRHILGGPCSVPVVRQRGDGLGAALESAFEMGLSDGNDAVGVLGADSPTLPPSVIEEAFRSLCRGADVALGPSVDGGYYLLAARAVHRHLFTEMPWSTDQVAVETLARCRSSRLRVHLLPAWYDVDDARSLARLRVELALDRPSIAPNTRTFLREWPVPSMRAHSQGIAGAVAA